MLLSHCHPSCCPLLIPIVVPISCCPLILFWLLLLAPTIHPMNSCLWQWLQVLAHSPMVFALPSHCWSYHHPLVGAGLAGPHCCCHCWPPIPALLVLIPLSCSSSLSLLSSPCPLPCCPPPSCSLFPPCEEWLVGVVGGAVPLVVVACLHPLTLSSSHPPHLHLAAPHFTL